MICKACAFEDTFDPFSFSQFGAYLGRPESVRHGRICTGRSFDKSHEGTHCASCGAELRRHHYGPPPRHGRHAHLKQRRSKIRAANHMLQGQRGSLGIVH